MSSAKPPWQLALPFPLLLALRYLKSARRDAYVTFLSLLAAGGIGLGVAALVLVLAGLAGLQDFLRRDVLARTPHLEIELPRNADAEAVMARLAAEPGVVTARSILRGRGWLRLESRVVDVRVVGFDGPLPRFFPGAVHGSDEPGLYLDDVVAVGWGLEIGELVDIVSPLPTLTPFGPQPRIVRQRLVGTFRTGRTEEGERRAAIPLDAARRLFGERQARIEVRAESFDGALTLAPRLERLLPAGSRLETWRDLNRALFFALKLEKSLMFISVFLIVPVAAMALVTVLALLISSKRAEIGMLQAMGATPGELRRAFTVLGSLLAACGLVVGGGLGVGGAWLLDRYQLIAPPGDVYFIDHVPFHVELGDVALVVGATLALTLVSTVWAARRAAALGTVEVLRR